MTHGGRYRPRKLITLECHACGVEFQATRPDAKYHSPSCRQQMSRSMKLVKSLKKTLVSTNAPQAAAKLAGKPGKGK